MKCQILKFSDFTKKDGNEKVNKDEVVGEVDQIVEEVEELDFETIVSKKSKYKLIGVCACPVQDKEDSLENYDAFETRIFAAIEKGELQRESAESSYALAWR